MTNSNEAPVTEPKPSREETMVERSEALYDLLDDFRPAREKIEKYIALNKNNLASDAERRKALLELTSELTRFEEAILAMPEELVGKDGIRFGYLVLYIRDAQERLIAAPDITHSEEKIEDTVSQLAKRVNSWEYTKRTLERLDSIVLGMDFAYGFIYGGLQSPKN